MKIVLISVLLFFELCSGLSIQKIQHKDSQTTEVPGNQTDVYEIEEGDNKIVRIVYPKPEKPVLREITYFHVVETPYEDGVDPEEGSEGPELDGTLRPFTNSHGFQFLADDPEDINNHELTKVNGDTGDVKKEVSKPDEENSPRFGEEVEYKMNEDGDFIRVSEHLTTEPNEVTTILPDAEEALDTSQSDIATTDEKKNARNRLFNQARGKYQAKTREKTVQRPKREVSLEDLPPAPTLRPLELGLLPEYIRKLISTPKPETSAPSNDAPTHFNEDKFKDEWEQKIHDMITSLKPQRDEDDYDDDDIEGENIEDRDDKKEETGNKRVPRTYGMNLTMGRGYVWNDLLNEPGTPGVSFDIGEPNEIFDAEETSEKPKIPKKPEATEIPTEQTEIPGITGSFTSVPHPTESKPIHISNNEHDKENDKRKPEEESTEHNDFEDIEVNKSKPKLLFDEDSLEDKENNHKEDKGKNVKEKEATSDKSRHEERKQHNLDNKNKHKAKKPEAPDTFKALMKNEQFWKWLSDWTATYMELLMKHIKDIVQDEVASQMKTLAAKLKKDLQLHGQNKDKHASNNEEDKKEHSKNEASKCDCSDKPSKEENHENNKPETPKDDDNKLIIDGREIPITHNTNFDMKDGKKENDKANSKPNDKGNNETSDDDLLRHKKHEDKKTDKNPIIETSLNKDNSIKSPISITAQNIYGNAAGSDKVTNIFIFYPHDDKVNSIISNETNKGEHTGTNNLFSFGSDEFEIDKRHPDLTGLKDESTMTENDPLKNTNDKPNDGLTKNKEESEIDKKEEAARFQTEPSTTTYIDKSENKVEKKEPENKIPVKENDMKTDQPNDKNRPNKSFDGDAEKSTALENKEHDEKLDKTQNQIKNKEKSEDDKKEINKNIEVTTEPTDSKIKTTTALPSTHENEIEKEDKIPENKEETKENSETTETDELEEILKKELEKEINKALSKEIEKELKKEEESVKEENENKDTELREKDSEKKKDEVQA